jgi:hypothetical protein
MRGARNVSRDMGIGAGEGNRTLVFSLGSCCSAIELHPHAAVIRPRHRPRQETQRNLARCTWQGYLTVRAQLAQHLPARPA